MSAQPNVTTAAPAPASSVPLAPTPAPPVVRAEGTQKPPMAVTAIKEEPEDGEISEVPRAQTAVVPYRAQSQAAVIPYRPASPVEVRVIQPTPLSNLSRPIHTLGR